MALEIIQKHFLLFSTFLAVSLLFFQYCLSVLDASGYTFSYLNKEKDSIDIIDWAQSEDDYTSKVVQLSCQNKHTQSDNEELHSTLLPNSNLTDTALDLTGTGKY